MTLLNTISENLLLAVKKQENTIKLQKELASFSIDSLKNMLDLDDSKKAFWINIYNAYFLILRKEKGLKKPDIYTSKIIKITNTLFSLDDIEHGILRKYRYKFSLGYLPNIFTKSLIKKLAVNSIDYRIHFALNCGAKSCPPIAFYKAETINSQLDLATQSFLESETDFKENEVQVTTLFKWFLGDFKGYKGIRNIYKTQLNKDISNHIIIFKPYNWEENLDNFTNS